MKMKIIRKFLLLFSITMLLAILVACGGDEDEASGENGEETTEKQDYPSTVTIGTASQGGTYYIWGGGLANLLEEHLDVTSNVEVTGGPVHNIQLMNEGDIHDGLVNVGPILKGYYQE